MTNDLPERLRLQAARLSTVFGGGCAPSGAAHLMRMAADFIESAEAALVKPSDVQRRLAMIESGDYSATEMAYDLERLARHPVWLQAEQMAVDAESAEAVERERLEHEAVTPEAGRMAVPPGGAPHGEFVIVDDEGPEIDLGPDQATFTPDEDDAKADELARLGWRYDEARGGFVRVDRSRET